MASPHIQVILADDHVPANLQAALRQTQATASFRPLADALSPTADIQADAVVVILPDEVARLAGALRRLFDRLTEHPRATLVMSGSGQPIPPLAHPPHLPVAFDDSRNEHDLAVRLRTLVELRKSLDSLHRTLAARRSQHESAAQRYARQLRLASQVQREFLPESLPAIGPACFDVVYRPVDYVSGDIYDVHRLDEEHIGIAVADATGHGIRAALLTVYIKRALRGKEIEHGTYRILDPREVLERLNADLLEAQLSECQFVAAIYAILNTRTRALTFARGGVPYPLHRSADGQVRPLGTQGGVVGVVADAGFEQATLQLQPGESVLFYTDGLERIVAPQTAACEVPDALRREVERVTGTVQAALAEVQAVRAETAVLAGVEPADLGVVGWGSVLGGDGAADAIGRTLAVGCDGGCFRGPAAPAEPARSVTATSDESRTHPHAPGTQRAPADSAAHAAVTTSPWCRTLAARGSDAALRQIECRQRTLRRMGYPLDDLTVVCLNVS